MAKQPRYKEFVFPAGMAKFTYLNEPQEAFEGKGDPKFKTRCILEDTPEVRAFLDNVMDSVRAEAKKNGVKLKKVHKSPFEYPEDQDEDDFVPEDGKDKPKLDEDHVDKIYFDAKGKYKPGLIDSQRQSLPDDVKIMGGDVIRVKAEAMPYEGFGSGVTLRIKMVQLIEKNTSFSEGGNTEGFDDEEGGYVAPAPSEEDDDDEIPF